MDIALNNKFFEHTFFKVDFRYFLIATPINLCFPVAFPTARAFPQVGIIRLPVCRTGNLSLTVMVDYHCYDGLAKNVEDYEVSAPKQRRNGFVKRETCSG